MTERFSVTEVRNAMRCPRIFALGRLATRAVAFPVGSSCLGGAFHKIVDRFAGTVGTPPAYVSALEASAARDDVQACLARWLLELLVDEIESDPAYAGIPGEVDDLAEALREFARHLSGRLAGFTAAGAEAPNGASLVPALTQLIRFSERELETAIEPGGPLIRGRLDAVLADARGHLDVVEYKLTDEQNDALDRTQVILYRELLRCAEGVDARPVILLLSIFARLLLASSMLFLSGSCSFLAICLYSTFSVLFSVTKSCSSWWIFQAQCFDHSQWTISRS